MKSGSVFLYFVFFALYCIRFVFNTINSLTRSILRIAPEFSSRGDPLMSIVNALPVRPA